MTPCSKCGGSGKLRTFMPVGTRTLRDCQDCGGAGWHAEFNFANDARPRDGDRIAPTDSERGDRRNAIDALFDDPEAFNEDCDEDCEGRP